MLLGVPCGQEVDWWALGIMMYAMMAGRFPFSDPDEYMLQHKIKYGEEKYPTGISKDAKLMMRGVSIINIKTEALHVLE
jgi:serine/threonine protein kinase